MRALDQNPPKNQGLPHKSGTTANKQSGGVIVWIFVAIALLAALSFAVTQGSRTGVNNLSNQQADLVATEMLNYANAVKNAVRQLQINGCGYGDGGLSFYSTRFANPNHYLIPNTPTDNSCMVFHPNGGGISWMPPPKILQDIGSIEYIIGGDRQVSGIGSDQSDHPTGDLSRELTIRTYVTEQVCIAINKNLGIDNPSNAPPVSTASTSYNLPPLGWQVYGAFNVSNGRDGFIQSGTIGSSTTGPELDGRSAGCFFEGNNGNYYFYSVLAAR